VKHLAGDRPADLPRLDDRLRSARQHDLLERLFARPTRGLDYAEPVRVVDVREVALQVVGFPHRRPVDARPVDHGEAVVGAVGDQTRDGFVVRSRRDRQIQRLAAQRRHPRAIEPQTQDNTVVGLGDRRRGLGEFEKHFESLGYSFGGQFGLGPRQRLRKLDGAFGFFVVELENLEFCFMEPVGDIVGIGDTDRRHPAPPPDHTPLPDLPALQALALLGAQLPVERLLGQPDQSPGRRQPLRRAERVLETFECLFECLVRVVGRRLPEVRQAVVQSFALRVDRGRQLDIQPLQPADDPAGAVAFRRVVVAQAFDTAEKLAGIRLFRPADQQRPAAHPTDRPFELLFPGGGLRHPLMARLDRPVVVSSLVGPASHPSGELPGRRDFSPLEVSLEQLPGTRRLGRPLECRLQQRTSVRPIVVAGGRRQKPRVAPDTLQYVEYLVIRYTHDFSS
jgi:hypothetical protein